ncbi:MAG: MATE family efflux transporter [Lachnospiraceae bacterium]|jgi:putative MATE family efflux protein|nr:MATE family efflux transporter [Lachnospiraceae bacterium]
MGKERENSAGQEKNNLTEGAIWKKILFFALPIFLGQVFQQLYNTFDSLIVGKYLGDEALAAVSSSGSLIFMMVGFFGGVAMGAGVMIAKEYGAKDYRAMRLSIHTDVAFGLAAGILLTVLGVCFTPTILRWMRTPENVLPQSVEYFRFYFCGAVFTVMYNIFVGILQAVGDSRHPLYYLIISSVVNVVLDLVLVGGFHFGVGAAAIATTISQGISVLLCLIQLIRCRTEYRLQLKAVRFHWESLKNIIRFGLPSGVQNSVIAMANLVVQTNINTFGPSAMAGCGSYAKIEGFAFLPITCFAQALSTFVGQNLGAKKYDRVKKGVRFGILCSVSMAELIGVVFWMCAPVFIGIFSDSPDVIAFGVRQARVEALFYCMLALAHCIAGIMRGAGKATVPMFTMLGFWCVLRVAYITLMLHFYPYIEVVFTAYPLTWGTSCVVFLLYFFKADWIHNFERIDRQKGGG